MKTNSDPIDSLDAFTRAYLITALWSSIDDKDNPLDSNYGLYDFAPDALQMAIHDCAKFQRENADVISEAIESGEVKCGPDFDEMGRAGHDFWLTRCRHGAGFWDGDWPEKAGDLLTEAAKRFGNVDPYVHRGEVHFESENAHWQKAAGLHYSQKGARST
jgi:hypothetical protein